MSSSALDFTSDLFDPVKALFSNKVSLPFPKAKTYNNIAEYFSRKCLKQQRVPTTTKIKVEPRERNYEWYYDTLQLSQSQRARIRRFKKIKRRKGKKPVSIVTIPCEPLRSNRITKCQSDFKDYCRRKYPYLNNISASQDMSWSYVQQMAQTESVLGGNQLESVPASFIKSEPFDSVPTSIIKTEPIDYVSTSIIKTEPDSMSTPVIKTEPFNSVSTSIIKTELSDTSFTSGTKAEPTEPVSETFSGLEILKPGQVKLCTLSPMENTDNKIHFEKACSLENQCKSSTMTKDFEDQSVVSYSKEQINKNSKQSATFYKEKVSISSVTDKTESSNYTVAKNSSVRELHCKTKKRKKKTIDSINTCKASSMSTVSIENKLLTSLPNEEKQINKHSTKPCKIKIIDKQLIKKKCHPDDLTLLPVSSMVPNDEFKLTANELVHCQKRKYVQNKKEIGDRTKSWPIYQDNNELQVTKTSDIKLMKIKNLPDQKNKCQHLSVSDCESPKTSSQDEIMEAKLSNCKENSVSSYSHQLKSTSTKKQDSALKSQENVLHRNNLSASCKTECNLDKRESDDLKKDTDNLLLENPPVLNHCTCNSAVPFSNQCSCGYYSNAAEKLRKFKIPRKKK